MMPVADDPEMPRTGLRVSYGLSAGDRSIKSDYPAVTAPLR